MKKMKKALASLLAATMVMSMSVTAWAASTIVSGVDDKYVNNGTGAVLKDYVINSGSVEQENFTFSFTGKSYKSFAANAEEVTSGVPAINDVTITMNVDGGKLSQGTYNLTGNLDIDAEDYELGVYKYEVNEVKPTTPTAGVTYSTEKLCLTLTILRDEGNNKHYVAALHYNTETGEKSKGFTNSYNSGSLVITKSITGMMANMSDTFDFTATFTPEDGTVFKSEIGANSTIKSYTKNDNGTITITFALGDAGAITFNNIPAGTTYVVDEDNAVGSISGHTYTKTKTLKDGGNGAIAANETEQVDFVNDYTGTVDTGILLDSAPYVLLLALAGVGAFAVATKKREEEF